MWIGQQVDVYANELRHLAGLAGFEGEGLNNILSLAFINGPHAKNTTLQQMPGVIKLEMSDIIARARILCSNQSNPDVVAVVVQRGATARVD
ncbi:hypothetical protein SK128_013014, partial [Halocaridina rubra]